MKILIDARPLVDPQSGGVRRVGLGLVKAICHQATNDTITLLTTGRKKRQIPFQLPSHVKHLHLNWPNKILSACLISGVSLETFLPEKYDTAFFPNLAFTGHLYTPSVALIHDLSFCIEPEWFSGKERLWHKMVKPKTFMKQMNTLFAV